MKVRNAVAGIEVSTEWVVLMFETRCTKGDRISGGSLRTRAATLQYVSHAHALAICVRKSYHFMA